MNKTTIPVSICLCLLLSGCGLYKQKAAGNYLNMASAAAQKQNLSAAEAEAAFASIDKAISYAPGSPEAVGVLEELAAACEKIGYAKARDLEFAALNRMLSLNTGNWQARAALINILAARGDVSGLADAAIAAGKLASAKDPPEVHYCALLIQLYATASAVPLLRAEAYANVNKSPSEFFENTSIYSSAVVQVADLKTEIKKLAASGPALKQTAPDGLTYEAEAAASAALLDTKEIERAAQFNAKAGSDPEYKEAVELIITGNAALTAGEYGKARAFYRGALSKYPDMIEARRQLADADLREGSSLAAAGQSKKTAGRLIARAYGSVNSVIRDCAATPNRIPFVECEKFLGEAYALKAAAISAMRAADGKKLNKKAAARLETELRSALEEARKLSPDGPLLAYRAK